MKGWKCRRNTMHPDSHLQGWPTEGRLWFHIPLFQVIICQKRWVFPWPMNIVVPHTWWWRSTTTTQHIREVGLDSPVSGCYTFSQHTFCSDVSHGNLNGEAWKNVEPYPSFTFWTIKCGRFLALKLEGVREADAYDRTSIFFNTSHYVDVQHLWKLLHG